MTDTGRMRSQNQDAAFATGEALGILPNLFLIADGMGGHKAGEYASHQTIEIVRQVISDVAESEPVQVMNQAITTANRRIYEEAGADHTKTGMGTTFVAASLEREHLLVANVGDSRLYICGQRGLRQVTVDHSVVEEMIRKGEVDEAHARTHPKRNLITRAVGAEETVRIDFFQETLQTGDIILMCTDGLTNMVENDIIAETLLQQISVDEKVRCLVDQANENGGRDNITAIVIEPFSDEVRTC
jgi:protein phosphatase